MKKPLLLLMLASLLTLNTQAQQKIITFGVEGGIGITSLNYDNETINELYDSRTGYAAGFALQYNFPKILSLRSGAMFESKGTTSDLTLVNISGNPVSTGELKYDLGYLTVPLLLRATFGNKINFFVQGGPYWATLLSAKLKYEPVPPNTDTEIDMIHLYESSEFGVSGGIGVSSIFNNLIVISIEVRNNMGITDIAKETYEVKTRSLLFLTGVAFTFGARSEEAK
ncbi:MAG TPA: porin family protein [Bacteroidia bacterium]|nr:porin family protein [Bacteroidia bacterium]